tara:strand:+ start:83 stop:1720 length:1638 start_codon:yes stop_codon:yes gene_type:complete
VLLFNAVTADFSTTEGSEAIFQYYESKGLMSGDSFEAFVNDLETKISARKGKPKDILKEILGKNYKGIPLTITNKGQIGIDHYKYGDTIPRPLEDYLTRLYGKEEVKAFKSAYNKSWADMSDAAQELFEKHGIRFDRGHFTANYRGGAKLFGASLERSGPNQAHGALHRAMNNEAAQNLLTAGRSSSWLEDFFQHKLASDNLDVLGAKYLTPADFEAINKGADPNQLMLERLDQVERSGIKPNTNILAAELDAYEFDTLEQLDRHNRELRDRYIVEKGYDPQSGQRASAASIEKAQSNLKDFDSLTDAPKPTGQQAYDQSIQDLHKQKTAPTLEKLPSQVNVDTPTPTTPTPEIPRAETKLPEVVAHPHGVMRELRDWLEDIKIDGWGDDITKRFGNISNLRNSLNLPGPWDLGANVIGPLAVAASTQDYSNVVPEVAKNIADEVEFGLKAGIVAATPLGQTLIKAGTTAFAAIPAKPVVGATALLAAENRGTATDEAMQQFADDLHYSAGGGNAAMVKHGWSIEQTREQGHKNLMKQWLETPVN